MGNRNSKGQFIKGHAPVGKPSPGRPKRNHEEKYIRWMAQRVKKSDWDTIVDVAIAHAQSGDSKARQWLSDYLIGKPPQQIQVATTGDLNIALVWPEDEKYDDSPSGAA